MARAKKRDTFFFGLFDQDGETIGHVISTTVEDLSQSNFQIREILQQNWQ